MTTKTGREKCMSKKEIYSAYGITFENGKIFSPLGWIAPLLKNGNSKVGKNVFTFSLLPTAKTFTVDGKEIKGTCPCTCKDCYGTKGCCAYKSSVACYATNTTLVRNHLWFVRDAISAQIEADGIKTVRIHAVGDFDDSRAYVEMWHDIVKGNPNVQFWTYTKFSRFENAFDDVQNGNIVKSVIPKVGFNFGECGYVIDTYKSLKQIGEDVYICRCGIDPEQHCTHCKHCSTHKYVLFVIHGNGYRAEKDARYAELVELINGQEK